ncbi:DinB family protein [Arcticibacterium luteifluviistationis]|uniref:DinB family protein n=1 Tax=Arcticibacterium luteifluviistationis TaxID=1784714 RepID=A0A2Z4GF40_9BACT|nr:DinB family protein [Arcticibacterium luteifluviistationis]AWV99655.1 DinB family protein [Arcticibacterium luteifluviistationis]
MIEVAQNLKDVVNKMMPILKGIGDKSASKRPAKDKWSPKEILGHLIDSANNNQMKFVKAIESKSIDVAGYHQNEWVDIQKYENYDWHQLIDFWAMFNHHMAHIIENAPTEALLNEIKVEGVGPFTLAFIMKDYVEHLKHHMNQILPSLGLESDFKMVY